jgi:hypothetical protein
VYENLENTEKGGDLSSANSNFGLPKGDEDFDLSSRLD